MELTRATSIFRCMPSILPPGYRRLLGSFAYAVDGAELCYAQLRETALQYQLPVPDAGWPARDRLTMFIAAWSLVDHVARARKLVSRFPWQDSNSAELNDFIRDTRPATQIRNRLNQLDDDIHAGSECVEDQAILGTVSWVDVTIPGGQTRYAISSGPCPQGEALVETPTHRLPEVGEVGQFRLLVAEQEVDLDALHFTLAQFAARLDAAMTKSVHEALAEEAAKRGVSVDQLCASGPFDMTVATRFEPDAPGSGKFKAGERYASVEVLSDTFNRSC